MTVWALLMSGSLVLGLLHVLHFLEEMGVEAFTAAVGKLSLPRSDHLWHTQVCDCQLEVALVEHLCACFLAARGLDPVQLVLVPLNRFGVVKGRRGHATTGGAVDKQAPTAESLQ